MDLQRQVNAIAEQIQATKTFDPALYDFCLKSFDTANYRLCSCLFRCLSFMCPQLRDAKELLLEKIVFSCLRLRVECDYALFAGIDWTLLATDTESDKESVIKNQICLSKMRVSLFNFLASLARTRHVQLLHSWLGDLTGTFKDILRDPNPNVASALESFLVALLRHSKSLFQSATKECSTQRPFVALSERIVCSVRTLHDLFLDKPAVVAELVQVCDYSNLVDLNDLVVSKYLESPLLAHIVKNSTMAFDKERAFAFALNSNSYSLWKAVHLGIRKIDYEMCFRALEQSPDDLDLMSIVCSFAESSCLDFWRLFLFKALPVASTEESKNIAFEAFSLLDESVFVLLHEKERLYVCTWLFVALNESDYRIRAHGLKALASFVLFEPLKSDLVFLIDSLNVVKMLYQPTEPLSLRVCCSLAFCNLINSLALFSEEIEGSLDELARLAFGMCKDADRIRVNGIRSLGTLISVITDPSRRVEMAQILLKGIDEGSFKSRVNSAHSLNCAVNANNQIKKLVLSQSNLLASLQKGLEYKNYKVKLQTLHAVISLDLVADFRCLIESFLLISDDEHIDTLDALKTLAERAIKGYP